MSDPSDRSFGPKPAQFRALFVPSGDEAPTAGEVLASVGPQAVRLSAAIVGSGQQPPGRPFVNLGSAQFRPDAPATARPVFRPWGGEQLAANGAGDADGQDAGTMPPPLPALAQASHDALARPATIWRRLSGLGGRRPASGDIRPVPPEAAAAHDGATRQSTSSDGAAAPVGAQDLSTSDADSDTMSA